jgi:S1-C subfamily serine protease
MHLTKDDDCLLRAGLRRRLRRASQPLSSLKLNHHRVATTWRCVRGVVCVFLLLISLTVQGRFTDVIGSQISTASLAQVKSGTGFFVSPDGLAITSAHVVRGCAGIALWPAEGMELIARILAVDAPHDLALLSVAGNAEWYADRLGGADNLNVGAPVLTIGFGAVPSKPREPRLTPGRVIGGVTDSRGYPLLLIRADLHEGNSGGPVIDADDTLLGMVTGRDAERPELGVAVPAEVIAAFVTQYITRSGSASREEHPINTADFLRAISVLVQCMPPGR